MDDKVRISSRGVLTGVAGGDILNHMGSLMKKLLIEYCGTCNYRPIAASLSRAVETATGMKAVLVHSRDIGAFEVSLDGELIFSKKEKGRFPEHTEIIRLLNK